MTEPGPRNRNRAVAELLQSIGDLLEVKGEVGFKVAAYRKAAGHIEGLGEPVERIHAEGRLRQIPGVGQALAQKIGEYLETGRLVYYDRLAAEFPARHVEQLDQAGRKLGRQPVVVDQPAGLQVLANLLRQRLTDPGDLAQPPFGVDPLDRLAQPLDAAGRLAVGRYLEADLALDFEQVADGLQQLGDRSVAITRSRFRHAGSRSPSKTGSCPGDGSS